MDESVHVGSIGIQAQELLVLQLEVRGALVAQHERADLRRSSLGELELAEVSSVKAVREEALAHRKKEFVSLKLREPLNPRDGMLLNRLIQFLRSDLVLPLNNAWLVLIHLLQLAEVNLASRVVQTSALAKPVHVIGGDYVVEIYIEIVGKRAHHA